MFAVLFRDANRIKALNSVIESCKRQIRVDQERMYKRNELSESRPSFTEWDEFYVRRDNEQKMIDALEFIRTTLPTPILSRRKHLSTARLAFHLQAVLPYVAQHIVSTENEQLRTIYRLGYLRVLNHLEHTQWEQGEQEVSSVIIGQTQSVDNVKIVMADDELDVPDFLKPDFTPAG